MLERVAVFAPTAARTKVKSAAAATFIAPQTKRIAYPAYDTQANRAAVCTAAADFAPAHAEICYTASAPVTIGAMLENIAVLADTAASAMTVQVTINAPTATGAYIFSRAAHETVV
jgi:hypothetical protein